MVRRQIRTSSADCINCCLVGGFEGPPRRPCRLANVPGNHRSNHIGERRECMFSQRHLRGPIGFFRRDQINDHFIEVFEIHEPRVVGHFGDSSLKLVNESRDPCIGFLANRFCPQFITRVTPFGTCQREYASFTHSEYEKFLSQNLLSKIEYFPIPRSHGARPFVFPETVRYRSNIKQFF